MWDLYLYISFYNIWKFGCLLWCWSINEQGSQKPEKKMFTGNSQVKTWSNWFLHMIPYPGSPNHQRPEPAERRLRFFAVANTE